ncbi:hypothetical protein CISG_10214 [Coccidioides immitis RMSCC 3703]|uniref:Uncharacterized protein n=1 Tax=Coccidioides immitis RMSCC 3703 TaxID=454286 RepID=A0A0J8TJB2_COCIT|nr:hypothetical protein CISG_10214 [Coccidioides immitis RMSCC 3703]
MVVQLDNIHFYCPPSLPKPPPPTELAASWNSSPHTAPVAQSLLHALPPKPPVAVLWLFRVQDWVQLFPLALLHNMLLGGFQQNQGPHSYLGLVLLLPKQSSHMSTSGFITAATQGASRHLPTVTNSGVEHSDMTVTSNIMSPSPTLPTPTLHAEGTTQPSSSYNHEVAYSSPGAVAAVPMDQERMTTREASTMGRDSSHSNKDPLTELLDRMVSRL